MWHKNISDILLLPSQLYLESECSGLSSDLWYLQISFEPPTSECDGQTSDLWYLQTSFELPTSITEMTAFTRLMWHKTYQTFSCSPS